MGYTKKAALKNSQLQREQVQLLKIQKELEGIMGKIQETINELKVEELQLNSSAVAAMSTEKQSSEATPAMADEPPNTSIGIHSALPKEVHPQYEAEVNQLEIDLDMLTAPMMKNNIEEEDDE